MRASSPSPPPTAPIRPPPDLSPCPSPAAPIPPIRTPTSPTPYADLADPDYVLAARSTADPEVAYARAFLRKLLSLIGHPDIDPSIRAQLAARAAVLLGACTRQQHTARAAAPSVTSRLLTRLQEITRAQEAEALEEAEALQEAARSARPIPEEAAP
jgi:hypothetical protein